MGILNLLKLLIDYAIHFNLLNDDKSCNNILKFDKYKETRFKYYTDQELELLIPEIIKSKLALFFLLILATGIKANRICVLTKKDINVSKSEITSTKTLVKTAHEEQKKKIVAIREAKYHPHVSICKALEEIFQDCDDDTILYKHLYHDGPVWFEDIFKNITKKLNINKGGLQGLANTAERIAIEQGMNHVDFEYCFGYKGTKQSSLS